MSQTYMQHPLPEATPSLTAKLVMQVVITSTVGVYAGKTVSGFSPLAAAALFAMLAVAFGGMTLLRYAWPSGLVGFPAMAVGVVVVGGVVLVSSLPAGFGIFENSIFAIIAIVVVLGGHGAKLLDQQTNWLDWRGTLTVAGGCVVLVVVSLIPQTGPDRVIPGAVLLFFAVSASLVLGGLMATLHGGYLLATPGQQPELVRQAEAKWRERKFLLRIDVANAVLFVVLLTIVGAKHLHELETPGEPIPEPGPQLARPLDDDRQRFGDHARLWGPEASPKPKAVEPVPPSRPRPSVWTPAHKVAGFTLAVVVLVVAVVRNAQNFRQLLAVWLFYDGPDLPGFYRAPAGLRSVRVRQCLFVAVLAADILLARVAVGGQDYDLLRNLVPLLTDFRRATPIEKLTDALELAVYLTSFLCGPVLFLHVVNLASLITRAFQPKEVK